MTYHSSYRGRRWQSQVIGIDETIPQGHALEYVVI